MLALFFVVKFNTSIADENILDDKIIVNGQINDGILKFSIVSQSEEFGQEFIDRLCSEFIICVKESVSYFESNVQSGKTISDIKSKKLKNKDIDLLNSMFN